MPISFFVDPLRESRPRHAARDDRWIDRWLAACSDLAELKRSNPMTDAVIDEIDGRMIRIGDRWLADFESALQARDVEEAARMFSTDCFWRDLVSFTWNIKTVEGRDGVAEMLRACLDSVLSQSYRHWELCIADDASPKPSVRTILDEYARRPADPGAEHWSLYVGMHPEA